MKPTWAFPPAMPFTAQVTAVFEVFCTVALKLLVRLMRTEALVGEMVMETAAGGATMVAIAVPTAAGSAWLVARMVTPAGEGTLEGAVNKPVELMVPALAVQVTA